MEWECRARLTYRSRVKQERYIQVALVGRPKEEAGMSLPASRDPAPEQAWDLIRDHGRLVTLG